MCICSDILQNLYKQFLRATRQWRDLTTRMQNGIGNQPEDHIPEDGAMAIFCPACPQPGVNLPEDWQTRYHNKESVSNTHNVVTPLLTVLSKQLMRTFIMDGNFSAEHMKCRTGDSETPLSPGMAFMANPEPYQAHLRSGLEIPQVCSTVLSLMPG